MEARVRLDEADRLRALRDLEILDTVPEDVYDRIVGLAARICEAPIALFSLVDEERQWFKARVGLDVCETAREVSFCAHAVAADEALVVPDATQDERFLDNPLVLQGPHIRSYTGIPVHGQGELPIGTLCVIDTTPRELSSAQRLVLEELAREVEAHLALRTTIRDLQVTVAERAVLSSMIAHDARNVMMTMMHWLDEGQAAGGGDATALEHISDSCSRLHRMCQNFVEVNGSNAHGIPIETADMRLRDWFEGFVTRERPRARREGVDLVGSCEIHRETMHTDLALFERITLNLLDNALRVTPRGGRVSLHLEADGEERVRVYIEDEGSGVPPELAEQIFEPYFSVRHGSKRGTGLGLAFCRLAAQALGGDVTFEDGAAGGARFVLTLDRDVA